MFLRLWCIHIYVVFFCVRFFFVFSEFDFHSENTFWLCYYLEHILLIVKIFYVSYFNNLYFYVSLILSYTWCWYVYNVFTSQILICCVPWILFIPFVSKFYNVFYISQILICCVPWILVIHFVVLRFWYCAFPGVGPDLKSCCFSDFDVVFPWIVHF